MSLECPISMDIMEDPITTPCGHTFDRKSLINHCHHNEDTCPICRESIAEYNPSHANTNYLVAELIEKELIEMNRPKVSIFWRLLHILAFSSLPT